MPSAEQTALEEFLLDIDCLNDLNPWLDDVNIFEILKVSKTEIRHSNFLAWLLNPNENHSFGDRMIKGIVCHLIKQRRSDIDKAFTILNATILWDFTSFNVYREKDNIDILIVSDTLKILICIENKVFSREHTKQTMRYRSKVDKAYPTYNKLFVFLTPDGDEALDYEYWIPLSYRDLVKIIEMNMALKSLSITTEERIFIDNYISGVKKHMMDDMDLQMICSKIYSKHRQALDLIFDNKLNMRDVLYAALVEKFESESIIGNVIFEKNDCSKKYIRFNTAYSLKLFSQLAEPRKYNWGREMGFMFCYQIENSKTLRISAAMSNDNLLASELEMCKRVSEIVEKKLLTDNWRWEDLKRTRISDINFNELIDEEFGQDKENIIDSIYNNAMKMVFEFEDKLQKAGL